MRTSSLMALSFVLTGQAALAAGISWAKDEASAKKAASADDKLLMVDFFTDW